MTDPDGISIHAPRTGSDAHGGKPASARRDFNPRSPHGERRTQVMTTSSSLTFQSTLPARGATMKQERASRICLFQSTLPARGATVSSNSIIKTKTFQSTLPARGATSEKWPFGCGVWISIHAPRTGSDARSSTAVRKLKYFNPRSPHGERQISQLVVLPVRYISIHAPRTGSDTSKPAHPLGSSMYFNPRSPHGERLRKVTILSIRIIDFAQKVYHKTVLLRISLAENAVILPEKPRNPVRTSLQKAGGLRFARAIRAAHPYSISSPSGA